MYRFLLFEMLRISFVIEICEDGDRQSYDFPMNNSIRSCFARDGPVINSICRGANGTNIAGASPEAFGFI